MKRTTIRHCFYLKR